MDAGFVAECFWTGVTEKDVRALDQRADACVADMARDGDPVRYLGSILIQADEVVLCLFEGSEDTVHRAVQRAAIPFERIVASTHRLTTGVPTPGDSAGKP